MVIRRKKPAEPPGRGLWSRVTVRHRAPGHIRFDLPEQLCTAQAVAHLERGLGAIDGVYRVAVFPGFRKLSIRWTEEVCDLGTIVRHLAALVDGIGAAGLPSPAPSGLIETIKRSAPVARLRARYDDLKAKGDIVAGLVAMKMGRKTPLPLEARDWFVHFANDLVVFYLVRLHWHRIIGQWMPNPWAFRYQWLAVVYLTFLLVRHRKAKKANEESEPPPPCCGIV